MRIKQYLLAASAAACVALVSGCEWSSGGGASSWNDSYNWVNFSGTYRGIGGGVLVTDYSTTPGSSATTNAVSGSKLGSTVKNQVAYGGNLNKNLVQGSIQITIGGYVFTDSGGKLTSSMGGSGAVDYSSGRWDVNLEGMPVEAGKDITASYSYVVSGASGSVGAGSGASGVTIYSFVVWQNGETIQITDNNGSTYNGNFGSISGTINATGTNVTPGIGESVIAQYNAEGISAAGYKVTLAGTFQGIVGGTDENKYLDNRQMFGTWIEDGGRTGDINGEASPVAITGGSTGGDTGGGDTGGTTGGETDS